MVDEAADEADGVDDLDAEVDAALAACGGSARAAIKALLIMQSYYEAEVERLAEAVSKGFTRGGLSIKRTG